MPAPIRLMVFEGYQPGYGFYNGFGALTRPFLKLGSTGPAVSEAQSLLQEKLGQSMLFKPGVFDAVMKEATLQFQRMYGGVLAVDGTIGKDTWTALLGQDVVIGGSGGGGGMVDAPPSLPPPIAITGGGKDDQKSNMGLYVGLGLAAVAAVFLLKRK